jgi:CubicO group peptidase (beta-lactamase class C family)
MIKECALHLDTEIRRLLPRELVASCRVPGGIAVRHLLEHTHGLEDLPLSEVQVTAGGFLDAAVLLSSVAGRAPLSEPGRLYSYGDVGALIAGVLLELRFAMPYAKLLRERLLMPCGITGLQAGEPPGPQMQGRICPSTGGALTVAVEAVLKFVAHRTLRGNDLPAQSDGRTTPLTILPGWSLLERGIYLGWKYYGFGWYGHNSNLPGAAALVRVNVSRRVALVIVSRDRPPARIAAALFGKLLPDLIDLRLPRGLGVAQSSRLDARRYVGAFRNGGQRLEVALSSRAQLELRMWPGTSPAEADPAALVPAEDDVFLVDRAGAVPGVPPFIQFLHRGARGFNYLWDGRRIWPAIDTRTRGERIS